MAKAFWTIVPATNAGGVWAPSLPALSSVTVVSPLDINRLPAGVAPADHVHLIVGNVALMSDQAGGGHEHYVANGLTVLRGAATAHTHADPAGPDFFLCFVRCSDADFVTLVGAPNNVKPLVMVTINGDGSLGDLDNTLWSAGAVEDYNRPAFWQARALSLLGLTLPAAVDRGKRLWLLLAGMFQSRRPGDDRGLRG